MTTFVVIQPRYDSDVDRAQEVAQQVATRLGMTATATDDGFRFDFEDDDLERHANDVSHALDQAASDWRERFTLSL